MYQLTQLPQRQQLVAVGGKIKRRELWWRRPHTEPPVRQERGGWMVEINWLRPSCRERGQSDLVWKSMAARALPASTMNQQATKAVTSMVEQATLRGEAEPLPKCPQTALTSLLWNLSWYWQSQACIWYTSIISSNANNRRTIGVK